jgi:hypothetical protein
LLVHTDCVAGPRSQNAVDRSGIVALSIEEFLRFEHQFLFAVRSISERWGVMATVGTGFYREAVDEGLRDPAGSRKAGTLFEGADRPPGAAPKHSVDGPWFIPVLRQLILHESH